MEMQCTVKNDHDDPSMQRIQIQAVESEWDGEGLEFKEYNKLKKAALKNESGFKFTPDGDIIYGELNAFRFAKQHFVPWRIGINLLDIMDMDSETYAVGAALFDMKKQLMSAYDDGWDCHSNGIIMTTDLRVQNYARGQGIGLAMLRQLKRLHIGIPFYYAAITVPLDVEHNDPAWGSAANAINSYYKSCPDLGLRAVAPRKNPHLLTAFWNTNKNPRDFDNIDLKAILQADCKQVTKTGNSSQALR